MFLSRKPFIIKWHIFGSHDKGAFLGTTTIEGTSKTLDAKERTYIYIYIPRNRTYARFHGRSQERKPLVINDTFSLPMTWQGRTFAPMTAEWERMYICSTHTNERDIHTARVNQLKPGRTAPARANQLQPGHHEGWMISDQETIFHWVAHPYHPYLSCFSALPTN